MNCVNFFFFTTRTSVADPDPFILSGFGSESFLVETDPDLTYYRRIFEGAPTITSYDYNYEVQNTYEEHQRGTPMS
jgi:hypothetical protein